MDFIDQDYWDDSYSGFEFYRVDNDDPVRLWIEEYFRNGSGTCFEVGCFPGRYLGVFGELGYELNGIDLTPRVEHDFAKWLSHRGFKVGSFTQGDFMEIEASKQFDIVCSFGFIEHYTNWDQAIKKHFDWLKPGGFLVLEAPNFRGWFQHFLHQLVDQENLKRHNLDSMVPLQWADLAREAGFEIIQEGYIGTYLFWEDEQERNLIQQLILKGIRLLGRILPSILPKGLPAFAPFCTLIARKPGN